MVNKWSVNINRIVKRNKTTIQPSPIFNLGFELGLLLVVRMVIPILYSRYDRVLVFDLGGRGCSRYERPTILGAPQHRTQQLPAMTGSLPIVTVHLISVAS
jgi:hypothetical protein